MINNVYFVGHGNPMWAISPSAYSDSWISIGKNNPQPSSIIVISAHWTKPNLAVTAMSNPPTIHDFSGFPRELYEVQYPAPGNPELAREIVSSLSSYGCVADMDWGLDHGTWAVLKHIYPQANIPVIQLSLVDNQDLRFHFQIGKTLSDFRKNNVLILASGNIVHNLYQANWQNAAPPDPRAQEFNHLVMDIIKRRDQEEFFNLRSKYPQLTRWAHPTLEHLLPLAVAFGASNSNDQLVTITEGIDMGSISMTSMGWIT